MPKRTSKKKPADINLLASAIVGEATEEPTKETPPPEKNPAAVALGRLGGLKGGKARAEKLSAKKRKEIAQKAAKARWSKKT
ncbi:MAG: hypothetical protein V3S49_05380 [Thermodesulfobacteriota bacterium]